MKLTTTFRGSGEPREIQPSALNLQLPLKAYHISVKGARHITKSQECQDYSGSACCDEYCVAVVCDGHGGERHFRSGIGAAAAVDITLESVKEFVANEKDFLPSIEKRYKPILSHLAGYICARWVDAVVNHFNENLITDSEQYAYEKYYLCNTGSETNVTTMYGTTLLIGVITKSYAFVIQTGDGACVVLEQDGSCAIPPSLVDERLFLGYTTSLCDLNTLDNFRFYFSKETPKSIVLSSDGVVDSYSKEDVLKFSKTLFDLFIVDHDKAFTDLADWLPKLSARGSRDDMSVAGVYRMGDAET